MLRFNLCCAHFPYYVCFALHNTLTNHTAEPLSREFSCLRDVIKTGYIEATIKRSIMASAMRYEASTWHFVILSIMELECVGVLLESV
jgi:uncharacterized CHY-type Zn-finger protein